MTGSVPPDRRKLEEALGYTFRDRSLLEHALNHASFAHEDPDAESNERLEFLGDAVVGLVIAELLFVAHPDWAEGDLTRGLHALVDERALAQLARELELGSQLCLGRTERASGGDQKSSILSDAMEAVLGAMYLDGGIAPVAALARRRFASALAEDAPRVPRDPKTGLQEWVMARFGEFPSYETIGDSGVEGAPDRFTSAVRVCGEPWGEGTGRSKRTAERAAAEVALCRADLASE